jgi:hypothetical protein
MQTGTDNKMVVESCELCIIGAGIAGLNALFAATQYLPKTARVVLVDRNQSCGGMWTQTYDYVRLHQPHEMFTVGDLTWMWDRPREYLATGAEVRWHLQSCLDRLRPQIALTERYRTTCLYIEEHETLAVPRALVHCEGRDGRSFIIDAARAIHAAGWDIPTIEPLSLSSEQVVSTCPKRLSVDDIQSSAPALVIGGGKTGMDTALALIKRGKKRKVTMLNGKGAVFGNRDMLFPTGAQRWWRGVMVGSLSADVVGRFDGRNVNATFEHFRQTYSISPDSNGEQYMFSTLSVDETQHLDCGLSELRRGYLEDVTDCPQGPEAVLQDGSRFSVPSGSLVVNCTGHLMARPRPPAQVLSPRGTTLNITPRASIYFLSTSAAYFLTHAFYLNVIRQMPLYALDMDSLKGKDPRFFFLTCLTHSFLNMMTIMDHVPLTVFSRCGLDLNRWYPLHRRLISFARLKVSKRRYIAHCRMVLDQLHQSEDISCEAKLQ